MEIFSEYNFLFIWKEKCWQEVSYLWIQKVYTSESTIHEKLIFLYSCWWEACFMKVNEILSWDNENTFTKRSCEIFPIEFFPTWSHIMLFILENFQSGDDFKAIKWIKGKAIVPSWDWKSNKNGKNMKALPAQYYIWGENIEAFSFRCQQLSTAPIHSCLSLKS